MPDVEFIPVFSHLFNDLSAQQQPGAKLGVVVLRVGPETSQACDPRKVVAAAVRAEDVVTAATGDGVVVLFGDARGIDDAVCLAERVRRLLYRWAADHDCGITEISAGAAVTAEGEAAVNVLDRAERALEQARESGGGRTLARSRSRIPRQALGPMAEDSDQGASFRS